MAEIQDDHVLAVDPTDDVGALTQARFHYQVELAAARCIRMLLDDSIGRVICEWHEDYIVQYKTAPSELVSVKHLEPTQPRWSVAALCSAGGVRHLFTRWQRVEERCTCRLQSDAGLLAGKDKAGALGEACNNGDRRALEEWAKTLTPQLHSANHEEVERFLAVLKFECGLPDRQAITDFNLNNVVRPTLLELGRDESDAQRVYKAVCDLVATASRTGDRHDVLAALASPDALASDARRRHALESKSINRAQVLEVMAPEMTRPRVLLSAPAPAGHTRTRLAKKLERGGLGPTAISSAARFMSNWMRIEHQWSVDLPGGQGEIEHLRQWIVHLVSRAEREARRTGRTDQSYAGLIQERVEALVRVSELDFSPTMPISDMLLLGIVYERTEACEIFWSERFDVDGVP